MIGSTTCFLVALWLLAISARSAWVQALLGLVAVGAASVALAALVMAPAEGGHAWLPSRDSLPRKGSGR